MAVNALVDSFLPQLDKSGDEMVKIRYKQSVDTGLTLLEDVSN